MTSLSIENRTDSSVSVAIYSQFGPVADATIEPRTTRRFPVDGFPVGAQLNVRASYPSSEPHRWTEIISLVLRSKDDDVVVVIGGPSGGQLQQR